VRWEELFADLDAEFDALEAVELAAEISDRTRRELARIRLVDRLRAAADGTISVTVGGPDLGQTITGRLLDVGVDWILLGRTDVPLEVLVPVAAVNTVTGLPAEATEPGSEGYVQARLSLAYVLRGIARDRSTVVVAIRGGGVLTGTIDRVGADYVDLAEHAAGEPRRPGSVRGERTVPFAAVQSVQRAASS
jgi:hypothetical protein